MSVPFRIERYGDRGGQGAVHVTGEDGVDRGPEFLSRLLHGVEASVYRNVFAFRLEELSELKGLTEGGVAARIYGAGLGTGAASALAVETGLRGEVAGLFKPGGSNPRINQLLKEIEEVERTLSSLDLPADYASARKGLAEMEAEQERLATSIDSLGERAAAPRAHRRRLAADAGAARGRGGARDRAGSGWRGGRGARALHEARGGVARVAGAGGRRRGARRRRAGSALAELQPDDALLARRSDVEGLLEAQASVRGEAGALREAEEHLASAERQLAETLAQLGDGWTEERVAALDLSVATRSALGGRFRDLLEGAARDVDRREIELGTAEAAVAEASAERDALDRRLSADAAPATETAAPAPPAPRWLPISVAGLSLLVAAVLALMGAPAAGAAVAVVGLLAAASGVVAHDSAWLERRAAGRSACRGRGAARNGGGPPRAGVARPRRRPNGPRGGGERPRQGSDRVARMAVRPRIRSGARPRDRAEPVRGRDGGTRHDPAPRRGRRRRSTGSPRAATPSASRRPACWPTSVAPSRTPSRRPSTRSAAELRSAVLVQEEAARIEQELREMAADHEKAAGRREQDAAALAALFEECGVASEAELRESVARLERRRALEEDASRARQSLAILSGHGDAADRLVTEIEAVEDIGEVRDRLAVIRTELDAMAAARDLVLREMGALQRQIETLEASVEMSAARQHHADLVSRLEAEAEDWSVRRLAVGLMERTRQRYEREHRPGVIKTAEAFLADWTDGRWVRIVAPLGGAIDGLERVDGKQVAIGALSRGTQEQLYLALRFGLIEHFADEAEPLPIVMDETLVNFDEARAERTARTIEQLSARHQILYFTCRGSNPLRSPAVVRLLPPTLAGAVGADLPPAVERVTA